MLWIGFFAVVGSLLALDLFLFHRRPHALSLREAGIWTLFWSSLGLLFTLFIYAAYGNGWFGLQLEAVRDGGRSGSGQAALQYLSGYLLEWSLSVDNLFVMAVIFRRFVIRAEHQHRILFWGILGAIVFRMLMILGGVALVERFSWSFYVLGGYLMLLSVRMLRGSAESEVEKEGVFRLVERIHPVTTANHAGRFFVRENGRILVTRAFLALVSIELADVVFAFDSVPAVLALTTEPFIVAASNIFAILGLRSLYFLLAGLLQRFRHLHWSLAGILFFVGAKMLLHQVVEISILWSLGVIVALLAAGVIAGLARPVAPETSET